MMDPVKFRKIITAILKVLIVIELVTALTQGLQGGSWGRFGVDLVVAGILYLLWERIRTMVRTQKETLRKRVESSGQNLRVWDALAFSLLWSDEIYADIPADRRRLVVISYTLIALGVLAAFLSVGAGLMPLVLSGALVLAAVNLVAWVVARERGEKEELQTELRLAHDVQMSLMPKESPLVEGLDIAGLSVPAREVGGDLYQFSTLGKEDGILGISVFDVSGKGMQAAMAAVFTSGAYASEAERSASPAEILTRLNHSIALNSRRGQFVAFLLVALDKGKRSVTFANAGQSQPLLRSGDTVRWLEPVGVHFPLGMQGDCVYEERTVLLKGGDLLFLLTDGFTDAMNESKEIFSTERFAELIGRLDVGNRSARDILAEISSGIAAHVGNAPQHDDMTMVVLRAL
jgi:serine phosphatase RsbU (regulator of sigma subunit)